jgi:ketosteroid isomerase-like protein
MRPIQNFFAALTRRDKAGMLADVAPNVEVIGLRKGELRRLTIDQLADAVVGYPEGVIAEPIFRGIVHVDDNLAVVWTPYRFTIDGRVDHCGTDIISLLKVHEHWLIVGLADNSREQCGQK